MRVPNQIFTTSSNTIAELRRRYIHTDPGYPHTLRWVNEYVILAKYLSKQLIRIQYISQVARRRYRINTESTRRLISTDESYFSHHLQVTAVISSYGSKICPIPGIGLSAQAGGHDGSLCYRIHLNRCDFLTFYLIR